MPIKDQAQSSTSTLSEFLRRHLPRTGDIEASWRESLQASPSPECDLPGERWEAVGQAFELRIDLDLAPRPEPARLLSYLPPDRYVELLTSVGMEPISKPTSASRDPLLWDWGRPGEGSEPQRVDEERRALTTCLDLVEVTDLYHKHPHWAVELRRFFFTETIEIGSLSQDPEARDALGRAWALYVNRARETFHGMGSPVLVAPEIAGGFGIADLVLGKTLVEIKITTRPVPPVDEWLRQVLGYLLADWDDVLGISTLVVYEGWRGVVLTCFVEELLAAASPGPTPTLAALREEFRSAVGAEVASFLRNGKLQ